MDAAVVQVSNRGYPTRKPDHKGTARPLVPAFPWESSPSPSLKAGRSSHAPALREGPDLERRLLHI